MIDLEELRRLHEFRDQAYMDGVAWRDAIAAAFPAIVAKLEADQTALNDAAYALFQIKRMTPEAIPQFAADAHAKACKHLDNFPAFDKEQHET